MKKLTILSAAILAACIVAPLAGKASLPSQKSNDPTLASMPIVKATAVDRDRAVYIIMRTTTTGSMIPTVHRIYRGRVTTATSQSGATYGDLTPAGSETVGGSLVRLDPSLSFGGRRH